jgi:hypothetical protein
MRPSRSWTDILTIHQCFGLCDRWSSAANSIHYYKGLKGTHTYKRLQSAYERKEPVPELITRLSKEHDDHRPTPEWNDNWEDTCTSVPVEQVVAYWSRVLAPAETCYSATEHNALAAKESLIRF